MNPVKRIQIIVMAALAAATAACGRTDSSSANGDGKAEAAVDDSFLDGLWYSCRDYYYSGDGDTLWTGGATIGFDTADKACGFYDGCNHWGARYRFDADSTLEIYDHGPSTLVYCPLTYHPGGGGKVELFNDSFGECLKIKGYETTIYRRPCEWFLQGCWVVAIAETDYDFRDLEIDACVDIKKHAATFTDCQSRLTAGYTAAAGCRIAFDAAPDVAGRHLKRIAGLLPRVRSYRLEGSGGTVAISFLDEDDTALLTLERTDPQMALINDGGIAASS